MLRGASEDSLEKGPRAEQAAGRGGVQRARAEGRAGPKPWVLGLQCWLPRPFLFCPEGPVVLHPESALTLLLFPHLENGLIHPSPGGAENVAGPGAGGGGGASRSARPWRRLLPACLVDGGGEHACRGPARAPGGGGLRRGHADSAEGRPQLDWMASGRSFLGHRT